MTITLDTPRTVHGNIVRDSVIVMGRELRPMLRDPVSVIFSLIQPLILLALFGPLLKGVPGTGDGVWNWFIPGVLVMIAIFGTTMTGVQPPDGDAAGIARANVGDSAPTLVLVDRGERARRWFRLPRRRF